MSQLYLVDRVETIVQDKGRGCTNAQLLELLSEGADSKTSMAKVEDAVDSMRYRKQILLNMYPFTIDDTVPLPTFDGFNWYTTLLVLSNLPKKSIERGNEVLDIIGVSVLHQLLGAGDDCIIKNFAWPPRSNKNPRPESFPEAIQWLGAELGLPVAHGWRPPQRKDGGVDLVGIRCLGGSPLAAPATLCQTTLSRDIHKHRDIDLGLWRTWIGLGPSTMTSLLVPHVVESQKVQELHSSGAILLDRLRICQLMRDKRLILPEHLQNWVRSEWVQQKNIQAGRL